MKLMVLLREAGLPDQNVIDVASVIHDVRPAGLLHAPLESSPAIESMIGRVGLRVIHRRVLRRRADRGTREGLLESGDATGTTSKAGEADAAWSETWFARSDAPDFSEEGLERYTGAVLGYPDCCVESNRGCRTLVPYYRTYLAGQAVGVWQSNRLATALTGSRLLPDYFPCSLSCEASKRLADACAQAVTREIGPDLVAAWAHDLRSPITVWGDSIVLWKRWALDGDVLELCAADAIAIGRRDLVDLSPTPPEAAAAPRLVPFRHLGHPRLLRLFSSRGESEEIECNQVQ